MTVAELDQAQLLCQFEEMIPALRHVRETDDARQAKYKPATIMAHEEDSPSVSNLQWSFKSHAGARLWGVKDQSHFLQIEGYQENTRFAWTTRFSLDIQRLVFTIENGMVLTFFAEKEKFITTPSLILQSFIQQAILLNMEKFRPPVCCRQAVSIDRLRDCGDDFIKLWSFFAVCLDIVQPSCIFVVLDNMDAMLTSSEKDDLDLFAQFLGGLAHSRAPFCKILTTVRMNSLKPKTVELSQCPCSGDECPHCSLLRIARVHRAGSDLISQRRKHRLSIVGTFIEPIDDPILAQLAAEDLEEQNERDDIDSLFDETDSVNQAETSTTPERQIDLDVSEQDSLLDDTDHALSDIFYSDSETDRKVSRKGLPPLKRTQNDHAKSADTDEDDIIGEIFCSENEDLGLSDVDQDSDHAQSSLTGPTQTGPSHVDNDLDYDEDFNNL
ncbi:hypothetical protein IQ06DRAFT_297991 [Phaeosphaeriaceae sp. SRC1lsM3a]|nr:hypothetical protein IQ06DRAFT_297991 [Stagonospora sp. SRC1lsM3a]